MQIRKSFALGAHCQSIGSISHTPCGMPRHAADVALGMCSNTKLQLLFVLMGRVLLNTGIPNEACIARFRRDTPTKRSCSNNSLSGSITRSSGQPERCESSERCCDAKSQHIDYSCARVLYSLQKAMQTKLYPPACFLAGFLIDRKSD